MKSVKELLLSEKPQQDITVAGWVRTIRELKNIYFVELNDGSTVKNIQIVFDNDAISNEEVSKLTTGSSIKVSGDLVESPAMLKSIHFKRKIINLSF